jgi:hypothetical protein
MRRPAALAAAFAAGLALAACQSQIPHGEGPIAIQANVQTAFQRHRGHDLPIVFLVRADGAASLGLHCRYTNCDPDPLYVLGLRRCAELTGQPCKVFAESGKITWRGPIAYAPTGAEDASKQPPGTFEESLPLHTGGGPFL